MRTRRFTEGEIARRRQWYADHDKRLADAMTAQYGILDDEEFHPDGLHRLTDLPIRTP